MGTVDPLIKGRRRDPRRAGVSGSDWSEISPALPVPASSRWPSRSMPRTQGLRAPAGSRLGWTGFTLSASCSGACKPLGSALASGNSKLLHSAFC